MVWTVYIGCPLLHRICDVSRGWIFSWHPLYLFTLSLEQNGQHFLDIFKCIVWNENRFISIQISLKFVSKHPFNKNSPLKIEFHSVVCQGYLYTNRPLLGERTWGKSCYGVHKVLYKVLNYGQFSHVEYWIFHCGTRKTCHCVGLTGQCEKSHFTIIFYGIL